MNQKRKRVTSIYCQYIKIVFILKIFCSRQGSSIRGKVHQLRSRLVHPMRGVIFWRTSFRANDDNMGTCSCSYLEPKQKKQKHDSLAFFMYKTKVKYNILCQVLEPKNRCLFFAGDANLRRQFLQSKLQRLKVGFSNCDKLISQVPCRLVMQTIDCDIRLMGICYITEGVTCSLSDREDPKPDQITR